MLALITATWNSMSTLPTTLESAGTLFGKAKFYFVDGGSEDGSIEFVNNFINGTKSGVILNQNGHGLYQALNQGIIAAVQDEQITHIGMLHSDDRLLPQAYENYLAVIRDDPADVFYSDIEFHDRCDAVVREWKAGDYSKTKLLTGWMPPHTSVVVRKSVYEDMGLYNPAFGTAADYEWIVRVLLSKGERVRYFPECTLSMLVGGASSSGIMARLRANSMDGKVWAKRSKFQVIVVRICKPIRKIVQYKVIKT